MFSRKRVAAFATFSALVVSVPLYAQFGGLDAFKRAIDAATGKTPSTPAKPSNSPSPSPTPVQDDANAMISRWSNLNGQCKGGRGPKDADDYPIACNERDSMASTLEQKGWCYGGGDPEWGGDDEWYPCAALHAAQEGSVQNSNFIEAPEQLEYLSVFNCQVLYKGQGILKNDIADSGVINIERVNGKFKFIAEKYKLGLPPSGYVRYFGKTNFEDRYQYHLYFAKMHAVYDPYTEELVFDQDENGRYSSCNVPSD
jgi:hypothetical protein